jgi:release factor glutamine methyltransferase
MMMDVATFLNQATGQLEASGIPTARLDVLVLLEDVLDTNRTRLLAEPKLELSDEHLAILRPLLSRRAQHIPLAYLRHKTEFYGREYYIDERVLEPRPESETMISLLLKLRLPASVNIADIGSGSGALGITAALELPHAKVTLIELDQSALAVSRKNVATYKKTIRCQQSDLLDGVSEHYDVLLCNLPYVPDDFKINTAALHEPRLAIFGGPDGLDIYRKLFVQLREMLDRPTYILTESLPFQHDALADIAATHHYDVRESEDFIQLFEARPS